MLMHRYLVLCECLMLVLVPVLVLYLCGTLPWLQSLKASEGVGARVDQQTGLGRQVEAQKVIV